MSKKLRGMSDGDRIRAWNKPKPSLSAIVETPGAIWDGAVLSYVLNDTVYTQELSNIQFCVLAKALGLRILPNGRRIMHQDDSLLGLQDASGQAMHFERAEFSFPEHQETAQEICQMDESMDEVLLEVVMGAMRKEQLENKIHLERYGTTRYTTVSVNMNIFDIHAVLLASSKLQDKGYKVHIIEDKKNDKMDFLVLWEKEGQHT